MKRTMIIGILSLALALPAGAQVYSFLEPPTLAVMDFEVSMSSAAIDANKAYFGQLISQALLTVLVQQNAAEQVWTPRDRYIGVPVYTSGVKANETQDESGVRRYIPPIFKIYDKKYVELALQNNNFTSRDLYAKSAGAYSFADLDFLVLGNVYETQFNLTDDKGKVEPKSAIGFNVRVLNTKRAEELYSYSAVVDRELKDLPVACARIVQLIMRDILNNHCAQFKITFSEPPVDEKVSGKDNTTVRKIFDIPLETIKFFWQPLLIKTDDATIANSSDSHKRELKTDTYYWALPGQYTVSTFRKDTQQVKPIPFTLAPGDIYPVVIEKKHLETEKGRITIKGVLPNESYRFDIIPEEQQARYLWEINDTTRTKNGFNITFTEGKARIGKLNEPPAMEIDGETNVKTDDPEGWSAEFLPETNNIEITNIGVASYKVTASAMQTTDSGGITGWLRLDSRLSVISEPMSVDLRVQKDKVIPMADFKLQAKKALDAPRRTKVSFLINPAFDTFVILDITDKRTSDRTNQLWWLDKEKITITNEYSQEDWNAFPNVNYTFTFYRILSGEYYPVTYTEQFKKTDLDPSRDTVKIINLSSTWTTLAEAAEAKAELEKKKAEAAQVASPLGTIAKKPVASTTAAKTQATVAAVPAASPSKQASTTFLQAGFGVGSGTLTYFTGSRIGSSSIYNANENTSTGLDFAMNASLGWSLSPTLGAGVGGFLHIQTSDEFVLGAAGTLNVILGDPSGKVTFLVDLGVGTGFSLGAGMAFMNPASRDGLSLRLGFMTEAQTDYDATINNTDYPANNFSVTLIVGYLGAF